MARQLFYRNVHARDHLESFLVSAVTALLLLRLYLSATGYPQVGGATLHIAHLLYGGLLMLTAIVINVSFLGLRVQRISAIVGGAGFGIFIDELGKFITKNNNYFFRPTIGLIYAIFALLYIIFNVISRHQRLSSQEYQLNALQQMEEAVRHDMDRHEKTETMALLQRADQSDELTKQLMAILRDVKPIKPELNWYNRWLDWVGHQYDRFWQTRRSNQLVAAVFIIESLVFLGLIIATVIHSFVSFNDLLKHTDRYATRLLIGQLASSAVAAVFAIIGAYQLTRSRLTAFEWFRRAILVNLFLTEFFIFARVQLTALPGFFINLLLLIALRSALYQERRHS